MTLLTPKATSKLEIYWQTSTQEKEILPPATYQLFFLPHSLPTKSPNHPKIFMDRFSPEF